MNSVNVCTSAIGALLLLASPRLQSAEPATLVPVRPIRMAEAEKVSYQKQVQPLLAKHCSECHSADDRQGGLDVTALALMLRGGKDHGPSIVPGKADESPLVQFVVGTKTPQMPKKKPPLSADEVHVLRQWIAAGARDDSLKFSTEDVAFFEKSIRPLLVQRCFKCHAGEEPEGGLDLASRVGILKGGKRGPAVVLGKPEDSSLARAIRHDGKLQMPRNDQKLSDAEIAALETWIRMGLPWPAQGDTLIRERVFAVKDSDREFWAFRTLPAKIEAADAPRATTPIDGFLLRKLQTKKLDFAPPADSHLLHRRLMLDLIGRPPTLAEIETFQTAYRKNAAGAIEAETDRLLALPEYGQRWGRHWLDLTRAGEPNSGQFPMDRYKSWVRRAVGADMPYDRFVQAHIAGDLMEARPGESDSYDVDLAIAAAVPLFGPLEYPKQPEMLFEVADKLDEGIEFLGRSILGLSLECTRCHDHKFDPISQKDYYALLGIFRSSWFTKVPYDAKSRKSLAAGVPRGAGVGTALMVRSEGGLPPADPNAKVSAKGKITAKKGGGPFIGDVPIYLRGDVNEVGEMVPRRFPELLAADQRPLSAITKGSGRLELAQWLVKPNTPAASLVARTAVNRVWLHLFGNGLVLTPDDLGMHGDQPVYPELVDYLARRFVDLGWSQKKLIREIVLSRAYQQSALVGSEGKALDPENRLLSRQNRRRLEAEAVLQCLAVATGVDLSRTGGKGSDELASLFDAADPATLTPVRNASITPSQALYFLNAFSASVSGVTKQVGGGSLEARIARAYLRILARPPSRTELDSARTFVESFPKGNTTANSRDDAAFTAFVHLLLCSNEFVYSK